MQSSYLVRFSNLDKHVLCPWTFVFVWMPMDKEMWTKEIKKMWLFSFRHHHESYIIITQCLLYSTLIRVKEKDANYGGWIKWKNLIHSKHILSRECTSVLGLHNDLCTEYSPFPCESLVHFLDFGLAGVSGHSKNFVGIELGCRC